MNRLLLLIAIVFVLPAWAAPLIPRFAYVPNSQDDTISIFALHQSGLRAIGYVYTGAGSNPRAAAVTPSQSFLYVAEGNVGIGAYSINIRNGNLTPVSGSPFRTGPEFNISIHPTGRFLFAQTGSGIGVYAIDATSGWLTAIQTVSGDTPIAGAIDPKGRFLYTANVNSNTVSGFSINQSTGMITPVPGSPFPSGANPQALVIDPRGKFLYVPNGNGASVSAFVINSVTGGLIQNSGSPFAAGAVPVAAVIKKSFLFVANSADKTISQYSIDPTTGSLTEVAPPFPTGNSGPLSLTANPAQPLVYVADHDSDELLVLGITQKSGKLFYESIIRSRGSPLAIALASGNVQVTYSPEFVYESNSATNDIWGYHVDSASGALAVLGSPFAAESAPQSLVSDLNGDFVFAANAVSNDVSAFTINSQTGALTSAPGSPFPVGIQPLAVAVDNGAHYLYVANAISNTISGFSVASNGALNPVTGAPFASLGTTPQALVIDPRGKFLYVANAQSNSVSIFEIDAGSGTLSPVGSAATKSDPVSLAINRDGKYLYALNQSAQNVSAFAIDSVSGQLQPIQGSPFVLAGPSFSLVIDPVGIHFYAGGISSLFGYRLFDDKGNLHVLPQSPFAGVADAFGETVDLSDNFLYVANNSGNSISGFQIDRQGGDLRLLSGSPYSAGTNPTSVAVVSSFQ